jgi:RNA polymerase sigma-70 factor, ECF subfamily
MDERSIVEEYRSQVLYFILRRVRDRTVAEELVQETLLILIQAIRENRLKEEGKLGAYIFGIAKNLILKNHRMDSRERGAPDRDCEPSGWVNHPEAGFLLEEQRKQVRRALERLSEADREILHYAFVEAEGLEEIASKLRIPYTAARKRKSRALDRLRKTLARLSQKGHP